MAMAGRQRPLVLLALRKAVVGVTAATTVVGVVGGGVAVAAVLYHNRLDDSERRGSSIRQTMTATTTTTANNTAVLLSSSSSASTTSTTSLVVPTLQAAVRVARLVQTCVLLVADYKLPTTTNWKKRGTLIVPSSTPVGGTSGAMRGTTTDANENGAALALHNRNDNSGRSEAAEGGGGEGIDTRRASSEQLEYWQNEHARLQQLFDEAQDSYAGRRAKNNPNNDDGGNAVEGRRDETVAVSRQERKLRMQRAAEQLAEAEEHLVQLGGGSSGRSNIHRTGARRLLRLCQNNGGVYVKLGQHLANLDYLLPAEYIDTLSALYDSNPVTPYGDVVAVLEEELGAHPDELFDSIDPVPIASASLAQVHVAYRNGQMLAVKVQHRGLRETAAGDLVSLVAAVRFAEWLFPVDFSLGWLADEIAPNLPRELDFQNEGRNAERAAQHMATTGLDCIIPKIIWDRTSPRVLTMEFEEGFKVSDTAKMEQAGLNRRDVANLVASVFASQVFDSGFVHCDPHEANVLVRTHPHRPHRPQMVLVDHGLYRQLQPEFQLQYARLWRGLFLADLDGIREACRDMGIVGADRDSHALFAGILTARPFDEVIERSKRKLPQSSAAAAASSGSDRAIIRGYAQKYLPDIVALLDRLPRQVLLLLKMNDCLRHIECRLLGSPTCTLIVTGRYAARAVHRHQMEDRSLSSSSSAHWVRRLSIFWSHLSVQMRLQMHETGFWLLERLGWIRL
jgi:aarF domain-containing kinase